MRLWKLRSDSWGWVEVKVQAAGWLSLGKGLPCSSASVWFVLVAANPCAPGLWKAGMAGKPSPQAAGHKLSTTGDVSGGNSPKERTLLACPSLALLPAPPLYVCVCVCEKDR